MRVDASALSTSTSAGDSPTGKLFGNAKNYPNAGMRERAGLVGEADGGTLLLDEIGELADTLQAHLLRVLDAGEYHRLGEDRARRADVRLFAATNREESTLKHDLLARLKLRLDVPGLDERIDDVPVIARYLLRRIARTDAAMAERFFDDAGEPRIHPELVVALLAHAWTGHVRELEALLVLSMAGSKTNYIALTPEVRARLTTGKRREPPTREEIVAALDGAGGSVSRAFRSLGLPSRDALNRLIRKYEIVV